jgi:hypothetical protein
MQTYTAPLVIGRMLASIVPKGLEPGAEIVVQDLALVASLVDLP